MVDNEPHRLTDPESSSLSLDIEPRQFTISLERQNEQFQDTIQHISRLIATGNQQNISLADKKFNTIEPELGFSRKIAIESASDPDYIFMVTGIGVITSDSGIIHVAPPDIHTTVHEYLPDLPSHLLSTDVVNENGQIVNMSPPEDILGAYTKDDGIIKYDSTKNIQDTLKGKVSIVIPVVAGFFDQDHSSSFFVYAIPKHSTTMESIKNDDISKLSATKGIDMTNIVSHVRAMKLVSAVEIAFTRLKILNDTDILHMQFHPANMYPQVNDSGDIEDVWISDLESCFDVSSYSRSTEQETLSAYQKAVLYQLQQDVLANSIVKDNAQTPESYFITTLLTRTLASHAIAAYSSEIPVQEVTKKLQSRYASLTQEEIFSSMIENVSPFQNIIFDVLEEYAHNGKLFTPQS